MKILKVKKWVKHLLIGIVAAVPLGFYIWWFRDASISNDPGDWAAFGSYIGGLYSVFVTVLVVYLARELSKKDDVTSKKKAAVEAIHQQILKIKNDRVDERAVNRLFHILEENKLYITDAIYDEVRNLADYYLMVKTGAPIDDKKEDSVKEHLRAIYNA